MNASFIRQPFDFAYNATCNAATTVASTIGCAAKKVYTTIGAGVFFVVEKVDWTLSAIFSKAAKEEEAKEEPTKRKRNRRAKAPSAPIPTTTLVSTQYAVEAHYDDGSRRLFGDPLFCDAVAAERFGQHLMQVKEKHIKICEEKQLPRPIGIIVDYAIIPLARQIGEEDHPA